MPGHAIPRRLRWPLTVLAGLLAAASVQADSDAETVQLRGYELQAWADARLQPRHSEPIPLRLALLRNDSATSSEDIDPKADRDDAERDGVPVVVLDALLAGQLQGSGRFVVLDDQSDRDAHSGDSVDGSYSNSYVNTYSNHYSSNGFEYDSNTDLDSARLSVRILRYQPPYRRGERSGFWQQTRSYWRSWVAEEPQPLAVTVEAILQDPAHGHQRQLLVHVDGDSCLRLQQAPMTAVTPAPASFSTEYRHSSIGQASLAAFNRIVAWLDAMHGHEQQSLSVVAVRGNRLQLADPERWLQGHQELTLYHRDHREHAIGQIRLAIGDGAIREAWPLTLAAGSVRPGDWVRIRRPTAGPSIQPAPQPPGSHCQRTADDAQTAAAAASDNRHTGAPLLPEREDDRPAS